MKVWQQHRVTREGSCVSSPFSNAPHTEGSGQFIFPHTHEKTIPAGPRVFLGSPGLWRVMTRRSGHVSRAPWRLEPLVVRQISAR